MAKENPVVGEIRMFGCFTPQMETVLKDSGWIVCDGHAYNTDESAPLKSLFARIGKTWGVDENNQDTTFRVPDLRGYFVRAWAPNAVEGRDPNAGDRVPLHEVKNPNGTVNKSFGHGYAIGSYQKDDWRAHRHDLVTQRFGFNDGGFVANAQTYLGIGSPNPLQEHTSKDGGDETRPKNVYLLFAIYAGS